MKRTLLTSLRWAILLLLAIAFVARADETLAETPESVDQKKACQCEDDIWIVNTRNISCSCKQLQAKQFGVSHLVGDRWVTSSVEEFSSSQQADVATVLYVHGNRMSPQNAIFRGMSLYRSVLHCCDGRQPLRYVIWSWPSEKVGGLVRDVRLKARRTDYEAGYLATFLQLTPRFRTTSLVGYSFGARVVTGALQSLTETIPALPDESAEELPAAQPHYRAALLAAAVHTDWLQDGARHGQALERTDQMLLMYNPLDPALKRYRMVERCATPQALGYTGFRRQVAVRADVEQMNVGRIVGRSHMEMRYYRSNSIRTRLRPFLLRERMVFDAEPEVHADP